MRREGDPQDWKLVVLLARALKGWDYQHEMAQACGIDEGLISDYERGLKVPSPATRKRMAAGISVDVSFLEQLVPLCQGIRHTFEKALRTGPMAAVDEERVEEKVAGAVLEALAPFLLQLTLGAGEPGPRAEDRAWAEEQGAALCRGSAARRHHPAQRAELGTGGPHLRSERRHEKPGREAPPGRARGRHRPEGPGRRLAPAPPRLVRAVRRRRAPVNRQREGSSRSVRPRRRALGAGSHRRPRTPARQQQTARVDVALPAAPVRAEACGPTQL